MSPQHVEVLVKNFGTSDTGTIATYLREMMAQGYVITARIAFSEVLHGGITRSFIQIHAERSVATRE